ncbi:alginate lyase family protein [Microvirga terrestris]|uniref:Alginate lyase family protein n=1 Tax=Microvirga terrestris TaxID=2791024 RepID=A0ABS0HX66_9HYPH|nr:alginate lyase family protein [Microvirga terrestris]MBF9198044.1 alginate lyase family protein [Microvirga terrestris]
MLLGSGDRVLCSVRMTAALLALLQATPGHAQRVGYLVPAVEKDNGQAAPEYECDAPGNPMITLETQSKYKQTDSSRATIDDSANEKYLKAVVPLRAYAKGLVKIANDYVRSNPRNPAAAVCALDWLEHWASANAMTDTRSKQALFNLGQTLGGFALAYLQIRNAPDLQEDKKKRVEGWLKALGRQVVEFMDNNHEISGQNNHRYWAGLAATAAGVATNDKHLTEWGMDSARIGLSQITPEGTLPLEISRGKRARDYHIYAAEPLVATAELARSRGVDLYAENDGALTRLVDRVVASLDDSSFFEKVSGTKQEAFSDDGIGPPNRIAWLEIHQSRFPSPRIEALLASRRPLASSGLGGDLTLLFHDSK